MHIVRVVGVLLLALVMCCQGVMAIPDSEFRAGKPPAGRCLAPVTSGTIAPPATRTGTATGDLTRSVRLLAAVLVQEIPLPAATDDDAQVTTPSESFAAIATAWLPEEYGLLGPRLPRVDG